MPTEVLVQSIPVKAALDPEPAPEPYGLEERREEVLSLKILAVLGTGPEGPILVPTVPVHAVVGECRRDSHARYGQDGLLRTAVRANRSATSNAGKDESSGLTLALPTEKSTTNAANAVEKGGLV